MLQRLFPRLAGGAPAQHGCGAGLKCGRSDGTRSAEPARSPLPGSRANRPETESLPVESLRQRSGRPAAPRRENASLPERVASERRGGPRSPLNVEAPGRRGLGQQAGWIAFSSASQARRPRLRGGTEGAGTRPRRAKGSSRPRPAGGPAPLGMSSPAF